MFVDFNILNQLGSPSINSNTFANRPAAGQTGRLFVSTDTYEIYRDNGTTWDLIGGPGSSTITGTGTATQVAYFTSAQAIGSSANLFWDDTNVRLGVGTSAPAFTIEANGDILAEAIYLDGATSGNGALYWTSDRVTLANYNASGIVRIETAGGAAAATFGADLTATIVSGIGTKGYTGSTSYAALFNGSVGVNTATPGAALDVHSTGTIAQFNTTSGSGNTYISWQRAGTGLWRLGDTYNGGSNFFELHNTTLAIDALEFEAATNKSTFQATQTYTTGLARANYFDYNLSVAAGGSFSSPNAITALGASLDLTLAGNATIPSGARSGLDAYNSVSFTGTGTLTHTQGTQIRAYSNLTTGWAFSGSATGTITHLAGLRVLFPDNTGSAMSVTNNYALLINDQTANTGTVTYTNRFGIYQEGASDTNYFAATTLVGTNVNSGYKFEVSGSANATTLFQNGVQVLTTASISGTTNFIPKFTSASAIGNSNISDNGSLVSVSVAASFSSSVTANSSFISNTAFGGTFRASDGTNEVRFGSYYNTIGSGNSYDGVIYTTNALSSLSFLTGGSTFARMFINSSGKIAIGDTGAESGLYIAKYGSKFDGDSQYTQPSGNIFLSMGYSVPNQDNYFGLRGDYNSSSGTANLLLQANFRDVGSQAGHYVASVAVSLGIADFEIGKLTTSTSVSTPPTKVPQLRITSGGNVLVNSIIDLGQKLQVSGTVLTTSSITTGAPSGGTAAAWKFGSRVAAAVALSTTQYIELDVGGTLYKLAIVT
jgi:hypothetical protein